MAALVGFFADDRPEVRAAAAWASGSVQDTALVQGLLALLGDVHDDVRAGAAFALGQTSVVLEPVRARQVVERLLHQVAPQEAEEVRLRCIEAAGKLADSTMLPRLAALCGPGTPGSQDWETALSIGRCAYRGVKGREATDRVVRLLDGFTGPDRWKAAWALMRIADAELLREHAGRIAAAAQAADPDVRMFAAAALARLGESRAAMLTLLGLASGDADWRVRVAAVRSLGTAAAQVAQEAIPALLQAAEDSSEHVSLAALEALGAAAPWAADVREQAALELVAVVRNDDGTWTARQARAALIALARGSEEDALRLARLQRTRSRPGPAAVYEALGAVRDTAAAAMLLAGTADADDRVARSALEGLARWVGRERPGGDLRRRARDAFLNGLTSPDPPLLATAAEALTDSLLRDPASVPLLLQALQTSEAGGDPEIIGALVDALGAQKDPLALPTLAALASEGNRHVRTRAVRALEFMTGRPHDHLPRAGATGRDTAHAAGAVPDTPAPDAVSVRLVTSRGPILIRLLPGDAPLTCRNFLRLASRGLYRGSVLHRVVPNFVVQTGDPRGDGWGGPGYAIRSEFGRPRYERGTVGMASSGKDTEGSQFFITHSRQPHLDGRYTVFGRVVEGQGVVDALQVGDRVLDVEIR